MDFTKGGSWISKLALRGVALLALGPLVFGGGFGVGFLTKAQTQKFGYANPMIQPGASTSTNLIFGSATGTNITWTRALGTETTSTSLGVTGTATLGAVTSTSVTTTRVYLPGTGSATNLGIQFGNVLTGIWGNGSGQLDFILNGNNTMYLDSSNGLGISTVQPLSPGTGSIGVAASPYGIVYASNVSSTIVTTTKMIVDPGGSATNPSIQFGTARTGFYGNTVGQIDVTLNGVLSMYFDNSAGFGSNVITPLSPNAGSVGVQTVPYGTGYINNVTSTNATTTRLFVAGNSFYGTSTTQGQSATFVANFGPTDAAFRGQIGTATSVRAVGGLYSGLGTTFYGDGIVDGRDSPTKGISIRGGVTTTDGFAIVGAPAAGTGLQPFCKDANGNVTLGAAGICPVSALAVKNVLGETKYGLDELMETTFVDYTFKKELADGRTHTGPVADWLEKNMPNLVLYKDGKVNGYDYVSMIGVLGQSIKDLAKKVFAVETRLEAQQREIDELKLQIEHLK